MSKAGKTMLLAVGLFLLSGAQSPSYAQEQLLTKAINSAKRTVCTPLESVLVSRASRCELKKLSQADSSIKADLQENEEHRTVITHTIEPIYYIPEVKTPQPTVTPVEVVVSSITPNPMLQAPVDMVPADGVTLDSNLIFDLINAHRASIGKSAFQKDDALCSLAATRSTELSGEFANGTLHSGLYNRKLPYWITENAKWGSNEAGTVKWWLNSPIHRRAIEGDYTYSCGSCQGSKCAQLFTSYTPKGGVAPAPSTLPLANAAR